MEDNSKKFEIERKKIKDNYEKKNVFFKIYVRHILLLIIFFLVTFFKNIIGIDKIKVFELIFLILWMVSFLVIIHNLFYNYSEKKKLFSLFLYSMINGLNFSFSYTTEFKKIIISFFIANTIIFTIIALRNFKVINIFLNIIIFVTFVYIFKLNIKTSYFILFCFVCVFIFIITQLFNKVLKNEDMEKIKKDAMFFSFNIFLIFFAVFSNIENMLG